MKSKEKQQRILNNLIHSDDDSCSIQTELTTEATGVHCDFVGKFILRCISCISPHLKEVTREVCISRSNSTKLQR